MNVSDLPSEERIRLYKEWQEYNDNREESLDFDDPNFTYSVFGHDMYFTKEQLEDPNYIVPEFGMGLPDWMRELSSKIGKRCKAHKDKVGTLIGMASSYEDYYYRIRYDDGKTTLMSCVAPIEFFDDEEKTTE